jgi:membrane protein YqaA with SNARE-associated domain
MWFKYVYVFVAAMLVDIVPLPLPPAFVVMVFLQLYYKLDVWTVIWVGVAGSILGRYILTLYIPKVASRLFNPEKNADVQFLGKKLKEKGWKSQLAILTYSLLPLPTTPLFIAGGMARMKPIFIIPAFFVGKFTSDAAAVFMGMYAAENITGILDGIISWRTISGLLLGLFLITGILFIDWRTYLEQKKIKINFKIWK